MSTGDSHVNPEDIALSGEPRYRIDRPVMTQQWRDLAYLHWRYDPQEVAELLPPGLEVDTYDGSAWVGLVPFHMVNIAPRRLPAVPYFGTFPETNVRTYVVGPEGPGVWFNSLDINRLLPVLVARTAYRLPYMWGTMEINRSPGRISYRAQRRWPRSANTSSLVTVEIGDEIAQPTDLHHFLSARWGLYTMLGSRLAHAKVDHEPWPLREASVVDLRDNFVQAAGYGPPHGEPHVLYSSGVSVRIDLPRFVDVA